MSEKRNFDRLNRSLQVRWKRQSESSFEHTTITKDISSGGICLLLDDSLDSGEYLDLEVLLSAEKIIRCSVSVVRCLPLSAEKEGDLPKYKIGVEFADIDETDRKEIEQIIISSFFT